MGEVEPGLGMARAQAPAGLKGGQAVQRRPGDFRPGAVGIRKCVADAQEGTPERFGGVVGREGQPRGQ